jgi:transcriptional regulator with XRE-family HTH domain
MAVPPLTAKALGATIRALRLERRLTIEDLAHQAHLHWTYLSDIERGRANPSMAKLGALATVFDIRVSALIAAAEEAPEPQAPDES